MTPKHIPLRTHSGNLVLLLERKAKLIRKEMMEAADPEENKPINSTEVCAISSQNNFLRNSVVKITGAF